MTAIRTLLDAATRTAQHKATNRFLHEISQGFFLSSLRKGKSPLVLGEELGRSHGFRRIQKYQFKIKNFFLIFECLSSEDYRRYSSPQSPNN
jgi:hypothetical protein